MINRVEVNETNENKEMKIQQKINKKKIIKQ